MATESERHQILRTVVSKVPEVTIFFWVIKVLATTIGETGADYLSSNLGFGLAGATWVMSALLVIALVFQFRAPRYVPINYWLVVVVLSIVGTLATDTSRRPRRIRSWSRFPIPAWTEATSLVDCWVLPRLPVVVRGSAQ